MTPTRRVLLFAGLACAFAALAVIVGFAFGERLAAVLAGVVAASSAFEAALFWHLRHRS